MIMRLAIYAVVAAVGVALFALLDPEAFSEENHNHRKELVVHGLRVIGAWFLLLGLFGIIAAAAESGVRRRARRRWLAGSEDRVTESDDTSGSGSG